MKKRPRLHYYSHRGRRKHPTTLIRRTITGLFLPLVLIGLASTAVTGAFFIAPNFTVAAGTLFAALGVTMLRLFAAYIISVVIGVALALLAEKNRPIESVLLPVYDVLESIPVLAFFPVIILFFVHSGLLEGAALFMLFFTMIWNITFNTIGGLKAIPRDVIAVGKVFGLTSWQRFSRITLPALFPHLVTASILALADGWNIVIVAEALHAYAPQAVAAHDLFGIGSTLVAAGASGNMTTLFTAMGVLVGAIALINIFVWQPLLATTERYKFE